MCDDRPVSVGDIRRAVEASEPIHDVVLIPRMTWTPTCTCGWRGDLWGDVDEAKRQEREHASLSAAHADARNRPHGPESPPVISPARTVEVSDRTGRTDPDVP